LTQIKSRQSENFILKQDGVWSKHTVALLIANVIPNVLQQSAWSTVHGLNHFSLLLHSH